MSERLVDRIPFAKIVTVLAVIFGIALGMCGLNLLLALSPLGRLRAFDGGPFSVMGFIELGAMLLSAVGMMVTVVAWVVMAAVGSFSRKGAEPQKLFDDEGKR